jgi:hypothetical protein
MQDRNHSVSVVNRQRSVTTVRRSKMSDDYASKQYEILKRVSAITYKFKAIHHKDRRRARFDEAVSVGLGDAVYSGSRRRHFRVDGKSL